MVHVFTVTVETDDKHTDAPSATQIANEIASTLEYDSPGNGIVRVSVEDSLRAYHLPYHKRSRRRTS